MKRVLLIPVLLLFLASGIALAQAPEQQAPQLTVAQPATPQTAEPKTGKARTTTEILDEIGAVLLKFLVLAVVFEVALTPIFSWRVFLVHFDGKGWKTPITIILALVVFFTFKLDIIRDLLLIFGDVTERKATTGGQILSALLIAGGSDGIWRIFTRLGIRNPEELKKKAKEAQQALAEKKAREAGQEGG